MSRSISERASSRRLALAAVAVLAASGLALGGIAVAPPAQAAVTLTASPTGAGTTCSASAPCSVVTAVSRARAGDTVVLTAGAYGSPVLTGTGGTATAPVRVRPADGATVTFAKLQTYVPNVTWTGLTVTSLLYVYPNAVNTVVERFKLTKAGSYLRANGTIVRDSVFTGGVDLDAVQIKDATGVTLERNTIRGYSLSSATSTAHVDCVQIFDARNVRLVRNSLANCSNAGVILSPGAGTGISGVTLEGNFIQGCVVVSTTCKGGSAVDLREPSAVNVVVRNNTIVDGATRVVPRSGLVFDRNVVGFLADCTAPVTRTLVETWNTGACARPAWLTADGNRQGTAALVNRPAGDLHAVDPGTVSVDAGETLAFAPVLGYDGLALRSTTAGADD